MDARTRTVSWAVALVAMAALPASSGLGPLRPAPDYSCSCSSRVVRMFTRGPDTPTCATLCRTRAHTLGTLADDPRTAPAVEAGRAAAPACTAASLSRDAELERAHPVTRGTPEYHHVGTADPLGVDGYNRTVADRCLVLSVANAVANATNKSTKDVAISLLDLKVASLPNPWTTPACNANARYRSMDGSCNNLKNPWWGQAGREYLRILCPRYNDGVFEPPLALNGRPLPNARQLRNVLMPNENPLLKDSPLFTLLVMQWGQLMAHDTTLNLDFRGANGFSVGCCAINNSTPSHRSPLPANETASICLPINGPGNYCLSVVRGNASHTTNKGYVGPAEHDNTVNSYFDASFVYGNDNSTAISLRTNQSGLLVTSGNNWLPRAANATTDCDPRNNSNVCFTAGDVRVNQNTQLTALQILFLRFHNRVAAALKRVNPQWGDERLYQEARRFVIAVWQHNTYLHLVPIYVGPLTAHKFNLVPDENCRFDKHGYRPNVDATTLNEYGAASNRIFHNIIQTYLQLYGQAGGCPVGKLPVHKWMDTPVAVVQPRERLHQLLLGLVNQPMQKPGHWIPEGVGEHLFETDRDPGQDLGAFDIQRGRDHGLPSYCEYRKKLDGRCCSSWRDLEDYIDPKMVRKLSQIYDHPVDVDLYVGLFVERLSGFALSGPTAVRINVEQFWRLKFGDRFFYSFGGQAGSFTLAQLCAIKKVTVARLFCDNGDNITSIQRNPFKIPSLLNPVVNCQDIPAMNFSAWAE